MEIVGYVGYASLIILAIAWTVGVRTDPDTETHAILRAVYFVAAAVVIAAFDVNMLHSLWVVPFGCFFSRVIAPVLINTPVVSVPFTLLADVFARVVRVGMPRHRTQEAKKPESERNVL